MAIYRFESGATITADDYPNLMAAWRNYGGISTLVLIERFIVKKPLTPSQLRRLPKDLKARLQQGDESDSLSFLEHLYSLLDLRESEGN